MKVTIKLFSLAKDLGGFDERSVELKEGVVASDVVGYLAGNNPAFLDWAGSLRLAVNYEYVEAGRILHEGDEVAVIPPVSGG